MSPTSSRGLRCPGRATDRLRSIRAFTMLELMIVVGIMALILMMGLPSIRSALHKEAFVQDMNNILDACEFGRSQAILYDVPMEMRIYPQGHRIEVSAVPIDVQPDVSSPDGQAPPPPEDAPTPKQVKSFAADLSSQLNIQLLYVNFNDIKDQEVARVRFYPNGTSYMFAIVILSDTGEYRKITLEEVTALTKVTDLQVDN